jgi:adenosylhomocysteine nucleosidase
MKILIITPIPVEYRVCSRVMGLSEGGRLFGCKISQALVSDTQIIAVQSGPAKVPDLVIDSGSCGGIQNGLTIGQIILSQTCYEYDISGSGLPRKKMAVMKLPTPFDFFSISVKENILTKAAEIAKENGFHTITGTQACGEYLINSVKLRELLFRTFQATGCNWETAGVFISALRSCLPALSIRIITDLANRNTMRDFRRNLKNAAHNLYEYIKNLLQEGWFDLFLQKWQKVDTEIVKKLPQAVQP